LVAIFDTEPAAHLGLNALRNLHAAGDITLEAESCSVTGVVAPGVAAHIGAYVGWHTDGLRDES
jgi:hypothetical protein